MAVAKTSGKNRIVASTFCRDAEQEAQDLKRRVAENLSRIRKTRGFSLEKLATRSGVSRGMLGQIEAGESAPTIALLWKVARGLDVRFADLLGSGGAPEEPRVLAKSAARILQSADGGFVSRALFPFDSQRRAEFYELRLRARHTESAEAHAEGTCENLIVSVGQLILTIGDNAPIRLRAGDATYFRADVPHAYANPLARDCLIYLVMTYVSPRD